jgi:hypothetical protein
MLLLFDLDLAIMALRQGNDDRRWARRPAHDLLSQPDADVG